MEEQYLCSRQASGINESWRMLNPGAKSWPGAASAGIVPKLWLWNCPKDDEEEAM